MKYIWSIVRGVAAMSAGLLLVLSASGATQADDGPDTRNLAKEDPELQRSIDLAIDRGAKWLASLQQSDGTFEMPRGQAPSMFERTARRIGLNALVLYTLAHCGHDKDDKLVKRSVTWMRRKYDSLYKGDHLNEAASYSLALWVLALNRLYAEPPTSDLDDKGGRYAKSNARKENPCSYPKWVKRAMFETLDWMLEHRSERGLFRYPGGLPGPVPPEPSAGPNTIKRGENYAGPEDLSNTQYIVLALWVGTRCGYKVPKATAESIAERILALQEQDGPRTSRTLDPKPTPADEGDGGRYAKPEPRGEDPDNKKNEDRARGFGYTPGDGATGAMTSAGLGSLIIVKAILDESRALDGKLRSRLDQGIWDAIAWLQVNYTLTGNHPVGEQWHYYYLYGLERALVIAEKRMLGSHDWYVEGARLLIKAQLKAGNWAPSGSLGPHAPPGTRMPIADTCFALLFLKRAAFRAKRPPLEGPVVTGGHGHRDEK